MRISGQATLDAPRESIWPLIFDPSSLLELLPGCEDVKQTAPDEYEARLNLRVPAVAGAYLAKVRVLDSQPLDWCRFEGEASGPAGRISGNASFTLAADGPATRIDYAGDAAISGPLAGMNPRFAEGIARTFISQGLAKLPALAAARAAEAPPAPPPQSRWASLITRIRAWFERARRGMRR
ncbi:MAG: carbon monoxide dehydrogenase subunit G [Anaerolineae bacterium]|jgi:carbon monoxide dehydrogenase subunit G|nr:carbon monoxide dehydrogenase subunit G [Anaerolineae bacterium]